jgi:hypothetical protein
MKKQIIIEGKKLDELYEIYLDCIDLEKRNDLTISGKCELQILKKIFE